MNGIWYYVIAFFLIWFIALIFNKKLEKYGVNVNFPILMWKTKRLRGFIDRTANRSPKFWKWFMNIGIFVSAGFMVFMAISLVYSLTTIRTTPSVSLIVPGVEIPGSPIFIPFLSGFIALATVIIVHEFGHGILARVEKVNIKSIGLLLFAILPGAFVEPDDEQINKLSRPAKLRIYVAGSISNLSLAAIALIIMTLLSSCIIPAVFHEDGVSITRLTDDGNAKTYVSEGMIIKSIDNYTINKSSDYIKAVSSLKPNHTIHMTTDHGSYNFKLKANPANTSLGYMGIQAQSHYVLNNNFNLPILNSILPILLQLPELFTWIFFLNFAIGTFNLLPMKPLDGGYLFENLLSYVVSDSILKAIVSFMTYLMAIIIVFSLGYSFFGVLL